MATALHRTVLALWLAVVPGQLAIAQEAAPTVASATLSGSGVRSITITRQSLSSLPRIEQDVSFKTSKGEVKGRFGGALLWDILKSAGFPGGARHNEELKLTFLVTGRDGYQIAFSIGEISLEFGNTPAMMALDVDGKPLPAEDGLRLIVPGDMRGARNVRDVVKIEVR